MEDQTCLHCKVTKCKNLPLKLMVNICGHTLCERCADLLFQKGSDSCPECNADLTLTNCPDQLFEDSTVEKEIDIRKLVLEDFNKEEEDFATLQEYNDYLEEVETIIFNLTHNIDVIETKKRIEQYKRENKDQIHKSKSKLTKKEVEPEEKMELEK